MSDARPGRRGTLSFIIVDLRHFNSLNDANRRAVAVSLTTRQASAIEQTTIFLLLLLLLIIIIKNKNYYYFCTYYISTLGFCLTE